MDIGFHIRWYWNSLRYKLGLTQFSPSMHEISRVMFGKKKQGTWK